MGGSTAFQLAAMATRCCSIGISCCCLFQSGSSGCLMSHNGRQLFTVGSVAKLYSGGGDAVDHPSVQASQGSFPANLPFNADHSRLPTKITIPAPWKKTPIVTIRFHVSQPRPGS